MCVNGSVSLNLNFYLIPDLVNLQSDNFRFFIRALKPGMIISVVSREC